MNHLWIPIALFILGGAGYASTTLTVTEQAPAADVQAIQETIDLYFKGHETGESRYFKEAFHGEAMLFWISEGALMQRTSTAFAEGAPGAPPADEAQRKRRIVNIDVSGNAAIAKLELDYPGVLIHDYMSMLKIDGRWKIVNKTFVVHDR